MSAYIKGHERHWSGALPAMNIFAESAALKREDYFARSAAHVFWQKEP